MFSAGPVIDGAPSADREATAVATPDAARRAVDQRAVAGADYVAVSTGSSLVSSSLNRLTEQQVIWQ